jgi:hypothetical protein
MYQRIFRPAQPLLFPHKVYSFVVGDAEDERSEAPPGRVEGSGTPPDGHEGVLRDLVRELRVAQDAPSHPVDGSAVGLDHVLQCALVPSQQPVDEIAVRMVPHGRDASAAWDSWDAKREHPGTGALSALRRFPVGTTSRTPPGSA